MAVVWSQWRDHWSRAAAAMRGALWVSAATPIEMIWRCGRPPSGIVVRNERIDADEIMQIGSLLVTTPRADRV
jgi:hypothetical protein